MPKITCRCGHPVDHHTRYNGGAFRNLGCITYSDHVNLAGNAERCPCRLNYQQAGLGPLARLWARLTRKDRK